MESRAYAHALVDLLFDHVENVATRPVVEWTPARELRDLVRIDGTTRDPLALAQLVARYSIQLHHPSYMGHQVCPPILDAATTDLLISFLNQSTAVWEMSPIGTVIEKEIVRWLADRAGYPDTAEGTAVSGGSAANLTGLLAARARFDATKRPIVVVGADAHYSIARAAAMMGIPPADVLKVATDDAHRMDVAALEETLAAVEARGDAAVLAIVATSGSTATGAFDKLDEIALLRDRYRTWLHVDAAHGASVLLSDSLAHLVRGLEQSDSFSWDPHKMMWMPLSLGSILVRDGVWLRRAFEADAPYLFHAGSENLGEMTIQCSKRADAIKLWLVLQSRGTAPIVDAIERTAALTRYLYERIVASDDFEPVHEPALNILCFRRRGFDDEQTAALRERLLRSGKAWITTTVLRNERVLRVTMMNPRTTERDVDAMLNALRE
ncbi:MAG: aminotransferase class I/II-fold pyridoxal phosphate-dependent enzyme [Acidobacteria bacterium]|nr:aminotransferase class I/II-fold pyridoxal phosphate-dependent enzyme [Acidobacteriota bacterium]MBV9478392.1 aminotransferase class I/II-fold pyridoxal phosphate-dependent enzyme [Acidobacteriota bacterium]